MSKNLNLLMIGAMYENGGNTTHRFLDGHPQLFVYPFESQLGTKFVVDDFTSLFPVKYRWPVFPLDGTAYGDYKLIMDEECKVRARTPHVSKFRHMKLDLSDDERCDVYQKYIRKWGRSRANNVLAFFRSTFDVWQNCRRTGKEKFYVGYSPVLVIDADKILTECPRAHFLHIVRNPWSAYADTKKRPVPLSLERYIFAWNTNQYFALLFQKKFPGRMHILRLEDILKNPVHTLGTFCEKLGLQRSDSLKEVSWNGEALQEVFPWGTIRRATVEANRQTANELSKQEQKEVRERTWPYLKDLGYNGFIR